MESTGLKKKYQIIHTSFKNLSKPEGDGEVYLFVVGINDYIKEKNLKDSTEEALKFINMFVSHDFFKSKNLYTLFDNNATKINIISYLNQLQKLLRTHDKLIIYFSGHGYNTDYSNFFIPHDGSKDNFTSCIPSSYIFDSITSLASEYCLYFHDIKLPREDFKEYVKEPDVHYLKALKQKILDPDETGKLFMDFVDLFSKRKINRVKESFCFVRDEHFYKDENQLHYNYDNSKLEKVIHESYRDLLSLVQKNKTGEALRSLNKICEVNDYDMLSQVETLSNKLQELTAKAVNNKQLTLDKKIIDKITCHVIERINQNAFYLVRTPSKKGRRVSKRKPKIKILFTSANPRDEDFLRLKKEAEEIEFELLKAKYRDNFQFIKFTSLSIDDLQNALLNEAPQYLHFSGHGSCDGLAFLDDNDQAKLIRTKPLANLFQLFSDEIQCIFLNSCHSVKQSEEISKFVKKVVCMNSAVPDKMAIHFAAVFYKSIGAGRDVDFSFKLAKNSIDLSEIGDSDIPEILPK